MNEFSSSIFTCFGIHIKIGALGFQHVEGQLSLRGGVRVRGRHPRHRADAVHVLLHRSKVDGLGKLWGVVIHVQDPQIDVGPGQQRLCSQVADQHGEPVVRHLLTVQNLCRRDHT